LALSASPALADPPQAVVGMPFPGKWAYNVNVSPPWTDANSSHPSVHAAPGGGDWATDLYAGEGTSVRLNVTYGTAAVSFSYVNTYASCGGTAGVNINVLVGGQVVGQLNYTHLANAVTGGPIANNMTLGTVHFGGSNCNPGTHVHMEFKNTSNYACGWAMATRARSSTRATPSACSAQRTPARGRSAAQYPAPTPAAGPRIPPATPA